MKKYLMIAMITICALMLSACAAQKSRDTGTSENSATGTGDNSNTQEDKTEMNVQIGDYTFTATLEQNQAVNELVEMMKEGPVTIEMSDYSGFEKVDRPLLWFQFMGLYPDREKRRSYRLENRAWQRRYNRCVYRGRVILRKESTA